MSLKPLRRMLLGLLIAFALRAVVAGLAAWCWTSRPSAVTFAEEAWMWLPLRWGFGLLLPAVLAVMAWKTLNVPNTQSATGILYIVVVFCFLGELVGQLLLKTTGYPL